MPVSPGSRADEDRQLRQRKQDAKSGREEMAMTEATRVGVIGCGFFARNHLHSWKDLRPEGAELVAVCDSDGAKA